MRLSDHKLALRLVEGAVKSLHTGLADRSHYNWSKVSSKVEVAFNILLDHFAKRRCLKETLKLFEWITGPLS